VKLLVQPESGVEPILQALKRARQAVDIAIFRLDRPEIEEALAAAVARGVPVRALVAHTNRGGEKRLRQLEQRLLDAGVTVARTDDDLVKYHGKYILIDDALHLLGFNLTKEDVDGSRSFGIHTRDRRAVRDARLLFEADLTRQPYHGSATSPLVVSPETSREALRRFVSGARTRLAIYDTRLHDREFVRLLRSRAAAGVSVQVLGHAPSLGKDVPVLKAKDPRIHVRAMIRDGTRAFVGSQSLRPLELDRRREVGLIVTNPAVARRMLAVFDEDWAEAGGKRADAKGRSALGAPKMAAVHRRAS
jgi:phosphatidylserine/phosphatidylglycerophosphate/cardiolipin synthase-like enzyme